MIERNQFPHTVRMVQNLQIPLSDGCTLTARLWLPDDAETNPVPAIVEYIPYRQHDGTAALDARTHPYFAGYGYAALRVDIRGSGNSEGVLHDEYLKQEQDDALEILAWIENQPWCNGSIGMIGISWGGFAALQIAALRPPQLKAIITVCSTDDRYTDDVHWMGGCLLTSSVSWGAGIFGVKHRPPDPSVVGDKWHDMWRERLESNSVPLISWLKHQQRDEFWQHGSVCEDYDAIDCAVYAVGGWTDGYTDAIFRLMEHLKGPRRALVGPWTHVYPHFGFPGPAIGFLQDALRWWGRWLKQDNNGIDKEPMLNIWMQKNFKADASDPTVEGDWFGLENWPPTKQTMNTYWLSSNRLSSNSTKEVPLQLQSPTTSALNGGEWCPRDGGGLGPEFQTDQRGDDACALCFDTDLLDQDFEILGKPTIKIDISVDTPVAMLAVRLCDVTPTGKSSRITFGLINLCDRDGYDNPKHITPGERFTVCLQLKSVAYRFRKGHRIRLAISTNYWPMVWPSPKRETVTLFTGSAKLELPTTTGIEITKLDDPFEQAEGAPELPVRIDSPESMAMNIKYDVVARETKLAYQTDNGVTYYPDIDLSTQGTADNHYIIRDDEPTSAKVKMYRTSRIFRQDWSASTIEQLQLTCEAKAFHVWAKLEAFDTGDRIFSREWNEQIPRSFK